MEYIYITHLTTFFPNEPIENGEMEAYIGLVNPKSAIAKRLVLERNGIRRRYYALDKDGHVTHTNVEMSALAVRRLLDDARLTPSDIDLLACGTASPEQLMPSHGVMVHGALGGDGGAEVVSFAGSCCTGMYALKYAWLSMRAGESRRAVCVASERLSAWMRARYFEREAELIDRLSDKPILAFEKEFLRWMLSDGSAALLLGHEPPADGRPAFRIEWIEGTSYADRVETCMYAGGEKDDTGQLVGWAQYPEAEWLSRSLFALKQDTRILERNIVALGGDFLRRVAKKRAFDPSSVDWFLPHLSSMYFKKKIEAELVRLGYDIPAERWYVNLPEIGNVASVSAFAMLDGLRRTGRLHAGQRILLMVPESARFSYSFALLTAI